MEYLILFSTLLLFILPCLCIFFLTKKIQKSTLRYKYLWFLGISYVISVLFVFSFAAWAHYSNYWLMESYGYDFSLDGDPFANVALENIQRVERLNMSISGIGWPLQAMIMHVFIVPCLLFAFSIYYLIRMKMNKIYPKSHVIV